jgi:hypothetical protein
VSPVRPEPHFKNFNWNYAKMAMEARWRYIGTITYYNSKYYY